tara:strand:+ start:5500 stop:6570 length:1071 start_codon:yes stop_codon:yes gene_type:complete
MNFYLKECTYLKYYIPLAIRAKNKGMSVNFLISHSKKYNCPGIEENAKVLNKLFNKYGFDSTFVGDDAITMAKNSVFITLEGRGIEKLSNKEDILVYSLVSNCDFVSRYEMYVNEADYIIFPNKFFAEYYNKLSEKNLYFGSPKYDVELDEERIYRKFDLNPNEKYALVIAPKLRDLNNSFVGNHIGYLKRLGYKVLVKTRGKDSLLFQENPSLMGDHYYEDFSWFPHDTMELLKISKLALNYGSTGIKEAILMKKPVVYFDVKPQIKDLYKVFWDQRDQEWATDKRFLSFLYDNSITVKARERCNFQEFESYITTAKKIEDADFDNVIDKFLFDKNKVCDLILKHAQEKIKGLSL